MDLDLISFQRPITDTSMRRGVRNSSCFLLLIGIVAWHHDPLPKLAGS
jgi:hypothetical protein